MSTLVLKTSAAVMEAAKNNPRVIYVTKAYADLSRRSAKVVRVNGETVHVLHREANLEETLSIDAFREGWETLCNEGRVVALAP